MNFTCLASWAVGIRWRTYTGRAADSVTDRPQRQIALSQTEFEAADTAVVPVTVREFFSGSRGTPGCAGGSIAS